MEKVIIPVDLIRKKSYLGYMTLGSMLDEKLFSTADVGVNTKILSYWKKNGLVDFHQRREWTEVSFVGLLWLRVLDSMRKMGCSIALMKQIYDHLFTRAFEQNLAKKNIEEQLIELRNEQSRRVLSNDESERMKNLESTASDELLLHSLRLEISFFYQMVCTCLETGAESGILIFPDQTFTEYVIDPQERNDWYNNLFNRPHINIPISSFIIDFINEEDKKDFIIKSNMLDEDELRVIREMRRENVRSITVTLNDETREVEKIVSDERGLIKGDKAKEVMRILGMKNYSGIELKTRDGKTLSFSHSKQRY